MGMTSSLYPCHYTSASSTVNVEYKQAYIYCRTLNSVFTQTKFSLRWGYYLQVVVPFVADDTVILWKGRPYQTIGLLKQTAPKIFKLSWILIIIINDSYIKKLSLFC